VLVLRQLHHRHLHAEDVQQVVDDVLGVHPRLVGLVDVGAQPFLQAVGRRDLGDDVQVFVLVGIVRDSADEDAADVALIARGDNDGVALFQRRPCRRGQVVDLQLRSRYLRAILELHLEGKVQPVQRVLIASQRQGGLP